MAALETPWLSEMSSPPKGGNVGSPTPNGDPNQPTYAAFSPNTLGHYPAVTKQRSTILVHQKSPLLVATPPQITRALAYSHPFILPLNKLVGLLSWTTGDPWESFLLLAAFWAVTLYGDVVMRWAGPVIGVILFIAGMYARRYSPLSSTGWTGEKVQKGHTRSTSEASTRHHKSLDEIVDALKMFTSRCNILLDPLIRMTDFLSTQRTATSATTRPALTTLFIRILLITPVWIVLTLPPFYIITTKRVILTFGTLIMSWHSRPARVSRTILWRSRLVRRISATVTGLEILDPEPKDKSKRLPPLQPRKSAHEVAASLAAKRRPESPGIRFTFTLFENQRRWLGIGWTSSMLAYERAPWTDEHLNAAPSKERFELPEVEGGHARWRWVEGSEWHIEGAEDEQPNGDGKSSTISDSGWIYYDNKWQDGRRGKDGWGRYTRRRKWCRDAELVEVTPSTETTPSPTPHPDKAENATLSEAETAQGEETPSGASTAVADGDASSTSSKRKKWFRRTSRAASDMSRAGTGGSSGSIRLDRDDGEDDIHVPYRTVPRENEWGLGDDASMGLS